MTILTHVFDYRAAPSDDAFKVPAENEFPLSALDSDRSSEVSVQSLSTAEANLLRQVLYGDYHRADRNVRVAVDEDGVYLALEIEVSDPEMDTRSSTVAFAGLPPFEDPDCDAASFQARVCADVADALLDRGFDLSNAEVRFGDLEPNAVTVVL